MSDIEDPIVPIEEDENDSTPPVDPDVPGEDETPEPESGPQDPEEPTDPETPVDPEPEEPEEPIVPDPEPEPEPDPDPIIRKEWEKSTNTVPNEKALKENGTLKMGTGVRGTYATVSNDGVIELSLIPMIPGRKVLGPAGDDGIFTKTEEGDVSCFFGVTSLKHPLKDVIGLYDSITLDVISDGEVIQKMDLQLDNDGWYDKNGEMLEGTYIDEYTIQEATRISFYVERGKEHKFVLSANSEENSESIEVTVIDEYVDPETPEEPEVPVDPEPEEPEPIDPEEPTDPEDQPEEKLMDFIEARINYVVETRIRLLLGLPLLAMEEEVAEQ